MPPATPTAGLAQIRFLEAVTERFDQHLSRSPLATQLIQATVVSVAAGGASNGSLVVIDWDGTNVEVPYLSSYTPVVNHVVAVLKTGPLLLILGRIVGTPN